MDESSQPAEQLYELSLKGDGLGIEKKISHTQAMQIIQIAMAGTALSSGSFSTLPAAKQSEHKPFVNTSTNGRETVGEFIQRVEAKRNPDVITAIAHFMRYNDGMELFTKDDVKARFRVARIPAPQNFPRDFNLALEGTWIAEDQESSGMFYITQTGEKAVDAGFSKDIRGRTIQRPKASGSAASTADKVVNKKDKPAGSRSNPTLIKTLDLSGSKNEQSLDDFYEAHQANTDAKRNVVFAHYLREVKGIDPVTESHILTCYHYLHLTLPVSMESSLKNSNATSRGGYLMSSNPKDIKLSVQGLNLIRELENKNKAAA